MEENIFFYKRLKKQNKGIINLLSQEELFTHLPEDWYVFVVDIENSTQAVQNGRHETINLSATGSIVTVLNEIKKTNKEIKIPYFFGGDGTIFIIPNKFQKKIQSLLENYRHHIKTTSSLILRVGSIKVADIYKLNHKIKIAKLALTKHLTKPIVLGNGLKYAENLIKSSFVDTQQKLGVSESVKLNGMECRWQEIAPEEKEDKVICIIVDCPEEEFQAQIYKDIFKKINDLFGTHLERNPISTSRLKLDASINRIKKEFRIKFSSYNISTLLKAWLPTIFGKYYFKLFSERVEYFRNIPLLSDTMMMDGVLHTVFSGSQKKIDEFIIYIDELERKGKINYGVHITHSSIMSCYVEDRKDKHIHFIDGAEGGYTEAALMYKSKAQS